MARRAGKEKEAGVVTQPQLSTARWPTKIDIVDASLRPPYYNSLLLSEVIDWVYPHSELLCWFCPSVPENDRSLTTVREGSA